jgi:hypothetical protein
MGIHRGSSSSSSSSIRVMKTTTSMSVRIMIITITVIMSLHLIQELIQIVIPSITSGILTICCCTCAADDGDIFHQHFQESLTLLKPVLLKANMTMTALVVDVVGGGAFAATVTITFVTWTTRMPKRPLTRSIIEWW